MEECWGTLWVPLRQVLPAVASGIFMPELVKVKRVQAGGLNFMGGRTRPCSQRPAAWAGPLLPGRGPVLGRFPAQRAPVSITGLFIRGVNNPCIVFLLLDYFVFV